MTLERYLGLRIERLRGLDLFARVVRLRALIAGVTFLEPPL
jgi:hypothetical protein